MDGKIVDFIIEHHNYKDRERIEEYVKEHKKYGTIDYAVDDRGNIIAVVRWNVVGDVFYVIDFSISKDWRNKNIGSNFIKRGLKSFPQVKFLEYHRGIRNKKLRKLSIDKILSRNIF